MATPEAAQTPTIAVTLVSMLPVAIGGIIAIAGGLATGILNHMLKASSERKEQRREKLEEVVALAYEVGTWLDSQRSYYFFRVAHR
jgi:hypothetical protein